MSDPKPLKELADQTEALVEETDWHAPIAEDGGNIEDNIAELIRRLRALDKTVDFYRVEFRRQSKGTTLVPLEEIRAILDGRDK